VQGNTELTALTQLAAEKSNPLVTLLPIIVIGLVFYFLLFRPQRRRQQQQAQMQRQIEPGQRVMTTAGMFATVVALEDDAVVLEVAPGVEVRCVKQAIGQVLPDDLDDDDDDEIDDEFDEEAEDEAGDEVGDEVGHKVGDEELAGAGEEDARRKRETLQDEVEAKTETLPGATGKKTEDASPSDDEDRSGKRPSA
jgi:preprotein translocase subunit YajC